MKLSETFRDQLHKASAKQAGLSPDSQQVLQALKGVREPSTFHAHNTFERLKAFPQAVQGNFLAEMYEAADFPNGADFGRAVARISNIKPFQPVETPSRDFLRDIRGKLTERYGIGFHWIDILRDFNEAERTEGAVGGGPYSASKAAMERVADLLLKNNGRGEALHHARTVAGDTWPDFSEDVAPGFKPHLHDHIPRLFLEDAEGYLEWVAAQDLIALKNPFEPFIDIWEQGGWFLDMVDSNRGHLGIYMPMTSGEISEQRVNVRNQLASLRGNT